MKRLFCLFAVLILTLTTAFSGLAETTTAPESSASTYFSDVWLTSVTLTRDAVYVKGYDGQIMRQGWSESEPTVLCRLLAEGDSWRDWDWEKMAADPDASAVLVYGDGTLWAVYGDRIGRVDAEGIHWDITLSEVPGGWGVKWCFVQDGVLYGLVDYTDQEEKQLAWNYSVFTVDLATGDTRRTKTPGAYAMTAYKDGLLLLRLNADGTACLSQLDATGALTDLSLALPSVPVSGLCWDRATDTLAVLSEKNVWVSRAGSPFAESVDLLPIAGFSVDMGVAVLTADGRYAFNFGEIQALPLDTHSDAEKVALTAASTFGDTDAQRAFLTKHPEVDLTVQNDVDILTAADVAERVRTGDTTDVLGVQLSSGFSALKSKGYVASVDAGQDVSAMLPAIRAALTNDAGQPCAGLLHLNVSLRKVNRTQWNEVLGDAEAPTTWLAFLTMQKAFIEAHDDDGLLLTMYFSCEDAFWDIMQAWVQRALNAGQSPDFSDPLLRETLAALGQVKQAMDARGLTVLDEGELHPESEIGGVYSLIWGETGESVLGYNAAELADVLLPFTFDDSDAPVIPARGQVLVVNPLSAHPNLAAEFIADNVAAWQNVRQQALLSPDQATPTEWESWQTQNAELTEKQASLTAQLAAANDTDAEALREQLAQVQAQITQNDEYRWEISAEGLSWWQDHSGSIRLFDHLLLCDADSVAGAPLMQLGKRWLDGQLGLEDMLDQFGKKAEMMAAEAQ